MTPTLAIGFWVRNNNINIFETRFQTLMTSFSRYFSQESLRIELVPGYRDFVKRQENKDSREARE